MDDATPIAPKTAVRGRHKVFLGYAAGVGKTYAMLDEARRRISRGQDVVIGYVEPHDRPDTSAMAEGIEVVAPKRIEYRGTVLFELDTDAVLSRHPSVVLIDELAHTNAPGTRHEKRWQSVDEILDAGIDVLSTVNVQHMESLNDRVFDITGVRVRETVPDRVIDEADEVVLVDVTPEALINRLERGSIYAPEKVPTARAGFFRHGNLTALREMSMRTTAEEIDDELLDYVASRGIKGQWPARDRVLVCITAQPLAPLLVRRGARLARRLDAPWWCLFVEPVGRALTRDEQACIREARSVAISLGAEYVERPSDTPAEEIIEFASDRHITQVVLGQSARTRWDEIVRGSIVTRIMRETTGIDVLVVADPGRVGQPSADARGEV